MVGTDEEMCQQENLPVTALLLLLRGAKRLKKDLLHMPKALEDNMVGDTNCSQLITASLALCLGLIAL